MRDAAVARTLAGALSATDWRRADDGSVFGVDGVASQILK